MTGYSDNMTGSLYLISPLVDDGHVDVVHEHCHLLACWRSIRCPHPLVYVAFHRALSNEKIDTDNVESTNGVKRFNYDRYV